MNCIRTTNDDDGMRKAFSSFSSPSMANSLAVEKSRVEKSIEFLYFIQNHSQIYSSIRSQSIGLGKFLSINFQRRRYTNFNFITFLGICFDAHLQQPNEMGRNDWCEYSDFDLTVKFSNFAPYPVLSWVAALWPPNKFHFPFSISDVRRNRKIDETIKYPSNARAPNKRKHLMLELWTEIKFDIIFDRSGKTKSEQWLNSAESRQRTKQARTSYAIRLISTIYGHDKVIQKFYDIWWHWNLRAVIDACRMCCRSWRRFLYATHKFKVVKRDDVAADVSEFDIWTRLQLFRPCTRTHDDDDDDDHEQQRRHPSVATTTTNGYGAASKMKVDKAVSTINDNTISDLHHNSGIRYETILNTLVEKKILAIKRDCEQAEQKLKQQRKHSNCLGGLLFGKRRRQRQLEQQQQLEQLEQTLE